MAVSAFLYDDQIMGLPGASDSLFTLSQDEFGEWALSLIASNGSRVVRCLAEDCGRARNKEDE